MSAEAPRISLVLPVRDGARFLEESLESVRSQTRRDWELVAVDDGSTDATPEILRRAAEGDPRIRVVRNEPARRLPGALNRGFAEARGALLTWTSDDNAFRPNALAAMARALDEHADVDVVYADYTSIDAEGRDVGRRHLPSLRHLGYSNVVGPCFLFRRAVWAALGGYADDLFLVEDYDFWLRASPRFSFRHLPEDLYRYRVHPAALSASRRDEVPAALAEALRRNVTRLARPQRFGALVRLEELATARGALEEARSYRRRGLATAPLAGLRRALSKRWRRGHESP